MYGHPFRGSFVGHSGEKCDLTLIVYPWFCRSFGSIFDRYLQKRQPVPNVLITLIIWCAAEGIHKGTLLSTISWKSVHKHVSRLRAPLFCTARFHDYIDEKHLFMNSFVPYINYLRFVWVPLGCISLAIAHERTMFPRFCSCVSHRR